MEREKKLAILSLGVFLVLFASVLINVFRLARRDVTPTPAARGPARVSSSVSPTPGVRVHAVVSPRRELSAGKSEIGPLDVMAHEEHLEHQLVILQAELRDNTNGTHELTPPQSEIDRITREGYLVE